MTSLPPAVLARLALHSGRRLHGAPGSRQGRKHGAGSELLTTRPYEHGDDARTVDPNATARTGELHVTANVAEVAASVHVIVDASGSMRYGPQVAKWEVAVQAAALIITLAANVQERTTLHVAAPDRAPLLLPSGRRHGVARLRDSTAMPPSWGGSGTVRECIGRLMLDRWSPGIVVVVTDVFGAASDLTDLERLSTRHTVTLVEVHDPSELVIPDSGWLRLKDPETGRINALNTSDKRAAALYAKAIAEKRDRVKRTIESRGGSVVTVSTTEEVGQQMARQLPRR